jgi:hypothetical protein
MTGLQSIRCFCSRPRQPMEPGNQSRVRGRLHEAARSGVLKGQICRNYGLQRREIWTALETQAGCMRSAASCECRDLADLCKIYSPFGAPSHLPVVVYFHGGGFTAGENDISPRLHGNIGVSFAVFLQFVWADDDQGTTLPLMASSVCWRRTAYYQKLVFQMARTTLRIV